MTTAERVLRLQRSLHNWVPTQTHKNSRQPDGVRSNCNSTVPPLTIMTVSFRAFIKYFRLFRSTNVFRLGLGKLSWTLIFKLSLRWLCSRCCVINLWTHLLKLALHSTDIRKQKKYACFKYQIAEVLESCLRMCRLDWIPGTSFFCSPQCFQNTNFLDFQGNVHLVNNK